MDACGRRKRPQNDHKHPYGRLVFDGHCGFCTRCVGWIRRLDRHGRVECVPLQHPGAPASVGATEQDCHAAVQWRGADGRRCSGAEAVNAALSAALGTGLPLAVYAVTRPLQDRAYAWIAVNRYRLRGVTPHCTIGPATAPAAADLAAVPSIQASHLLML